MPILDLLLALVVGASQLWAVTVPVLVMGIFALVIRLALRRYY